MDQSLEQIIVVVNALVTAIYGLIKIFQKIRR